MTEPVLEQIALALKARLETIAPPTYTETIASVVRPPRSDTSAYTPTDRLCVLLQGDEALDEEREGAGDAWSYLVQPFEVTVFVVPSDADDTPIETYFNRLRSDIIKAVATGRTLIVSGAALADDIEIGPAVMSRHESGAEFIAIPLAVRYHTKRDDPTSQ